MLLARYSKWNLPCMALWARLGLQGTKVGNDAIDVEVNKGLGLGRPTFEALLI